MKEIFDKTKAVCDVCGTPVDERRKRGDKYYCQSDFDKTSAEEKIENAKTEQNYNDYKKLFN